MQDKVEKILATKVRTSGYQPRVVQLDDGHYYLAVGSDDGNTTGYGGKITKVKDEDHTYYLDGKAPECGKELLAVAEPYRSDAHDFIALGSSFCLCGVFFWSFVLKIEELSGALVEPARWTRRGRDAKSATRRCPSQHEVL